MRKYGAKRVLVTGGAGFLGSFLCERLLAEGNEVLCVDNFYTGTRSNIADLLRARLRKVVAARRFVIHAWYVDPREPWPDGRDCPQNQAVSV